MKKNKKILIGLFVFITLLIILPFFISVRTYLDQAESAATEKLGVPVKIASGRLLLLPSPRAVVRGITIGQHDELEVATLTVLPTLSTLFSPTKIIDLHIEQPTVKQSAIALLSALSSGKPEADTATTSFSVAKVSIDELHLDWPDLAVPLLNMEFNLKDDYSVAYAKLNTIDNALNVEMTPENGGHLILMNAERWTLPAGLPLLIDKAALTMHLKGAQLEIPSIDIALYGGKLTGHTDVSWQKAWKMKGKLNVANLSVKEPTALISHSVYLSGNLFGDAAFSASAKEAGGLVDNLQADFKFSVHKGVLHGLDLVKLASLLVKTGEKGGETQFDEFAGLLNVAGKQYHVRDIKISSGLLAATGQVKVKPNKDLDGAVEVELKRSVSLVAIPLDVSGTVSDPVVLPSKAALAGALAGTAILGPGVGTSLGVKAGGAIDKLKGLFQNK